jgi:peptide/nickel transport system permease protein
VKQAEAPGRRGCHEPLLVIGVVAIVVAALVAIFAPFLTPYNPQAITGRALETPSARHWLGTDIPGRDIFSQLLYGTRASLIAAVTGGALAMAGAILVGVLPTMLSRSADAVSNRLQVFLLAIPGLPLLIVIGSLAANNQVILILAIAFTGVAPNARILRSQARALRDRGFISAARGFGGGPAYVLRRHLIPAMGPLVVVGFVNWASVAIGLQAGLAFLGLGDPSGVSWGQMLNRALSQQSIYFSPLWVWWVLPPGLAITALLLGFTFIGVSLEPTFNPRWRRASS